MYMRLGLRGSGGGGSGGGDMVVVVAVVVVAVVVVTVVVVAVVVVIKAMQGSHSVGIRIPFTTEILVSNGHIL